MAEHVTKLFHLLSTSSSPSDLFLSLRTDHSSRQALLILYRILKRAVSPLGDPSHTLVFSSWTDLQIHSVVSLGIAIASASRSLSVEEANPMVVAVVQQFLEFAVCYLENSDFSTNDFSMQSNAVLLMELAMVDVIDKVPGPVQSCLVNNFLELLPIIADDCCGVELDSHLICSQGVGCTRGEKPVDRLLLTLTSECIPSEWQASQFSGPTQHLNSLIFLFQHWATIHVNCIQRLLSCCNKLVKLPDSFDEKFLGPDFYNRLSFSLRILKLLRDIVRAIPCVEYDNSLLREVASWADALPGLFRLSFEFANSHASVDTGLESLIPSLLEEFLHLIQVIFGNSVALSNIQVCIVASMLESLDASLWRYNKSSANPKPPLAYFPQSVLYMLKLIRDIKRHSYHAFDSQQIDVELPGCSTDTLNEGPSSSAPCEQVPLLKRFTVDESLKIIFNSSQWMDNLMHLTFFLHSEGVKLRPKVERSHSTCSKSTFSELENAVCHEDEALFGNLFSEGGRSVGSVDGYDQSAVALSSSGNSNMPIQAATETLRFLKDCVFSHEWSPSLFEDGCRSLRESHLDILLSILNCQGCCSDDKSSDYLASSHEERKIGHPHELCFELLHNLLTHHVMSDSLEEYLIDLILKVENDSFVYNDQTLTLLAHALSSAVGLAGSNLRTKLYTGFIGFIVDKAKSVCLNSPSFRDLVGTLPSVFHVEILLMAFHLSSEEEKATLASLIFSAIQAVDVPHVGFSATQLSCWALLMSRLVLLLRHMIFHPRTCPPSFVLELRLKLREAPVCGSIPHNGVHDQLLSWATIAAKSLLVGAIEEEPFLSTFINQLIDISTLPSLLCRGEMAFNFLCLSPKDVCETFSRILGFWKGKRAVVIEDLIVERYMFSLCAMSSASADTLSLGSEPEALDMSAMFNFFSNSLLGNGDDIDKGNFPDAAAVGMLQNLCAVNIPVEIEELGWDFLRNGSWLSLVLSSFNVGLRKYGIRNNVPGASPFWIESTATDTDYINAAEGLASSVVEAEQVSALVGMLSSLLNGYLQAYNKAFIATVGNGQFDADRFPSLLILKDSAFDKCMQDELVKKTGLKPYILDSVSDLLSKLDSLVDKRAVGIRSKVFWGCMLHGFPSHLQTSSAVLVSCILSIKEIIFTLDSLFALENLREKIFLEDAVFHQILDSVMTIKFDQIFENLQGKCEAIVQNLRTGFESSDYTHLFLMKHMEGCLREITAKEMADNTVLEGVISRFVDFFDSLRKDPMKFGVFKFYLGGEDVPKPLMDFAEAGDILVLIDSLHNCCSESVNEKVLNFFVELLSGEFGSNLRVKLQKKFLEMDMLHLSKWLEKRLLGCVAEASAGTICAKGSSVTLRETTMSFIFSLVSLPSDSLVAELHNHLFDAVLASLDSAFLQYDILVAKSYFNFVARISRGECTMKLLLRKAIMLMDKLAGDESLLPGLKFLFGFLRTVVSDCGSSRKTLEISSVKSTPCDTGVGPIHLKPVGSSKNPDTLLLPTNHDGGSTALECDASSADEDEDDGTSDGEVASMDKDDEDDTNSERALASKVCTFTCSGSNFMEQHWYFCYTCDLTVSKGCCSVCAKVCHRGHRVVYSRSSRFFCDCGAGGVRGSNCQCLKPRKFTGSDNVPVRGASTLPSFLPFAEDADQLAESDSDLEEDVTMDIDNSLGLSIARELQDIIPMFLEELDVEGRVLQLCSLLLPSIVSKRDTNTSNDKKVILGIDKVLSDGVELLQLKKAYKSGSLDLKIKADYSNSKELRSHLATGSLVKSLLSVSNRGRLAVGEGDKVAIFDVGQLIGQVTTVPVTADKTNVKPLSRNIVRFEIVHLAFNSMVENYLAVSGYEDCQVLTLNPRGEVTDRLAIELALQGAYIRRIDWVPGSQVKLMVVTNRFIKIYDLSQDNISPLHYFTLPDDTIVDATLVMPTLGRTFLIVLSERGCLFRLELSLEGNIGATPLREAIHISDREINSKGSSLYFSSTYKLLFLSNQDGTTLMGRLSSDATSLMEISFLYEEEQDGKKPPAGLHRWKELLSGSGLFVCFSSLKSNAALAVSIGAHELHAQNMRHGVSSTTHTVGLTAYKPLSKDKIHCLVLHDDGSLQIYSHSPVGANSGGNVAAEKVKKLGPAILNNKAYSGVKAEFPLDFFEKTVCITGDVKLGGDAIRNGDSEGAKQNLTTEDGFLESPNPAGFKISLSNSNPDIVMVGFRVHVGNTSPSHIPSDITIFQRVIKLDEGMRSWYDVPFTVAESLLADEEFIITVGPTFNGTTLPRIDSLEVYGRAKDEFGWKEKMDAVLDMEARVLGSNSLLIGSGKKSRPLQSISVQEQVIADGLKFLSRLYSLRLSHEDAKVESNELKSKLLLETIFESDREPLLQSAACHVLQAVYGKKDEYYQVKDTMRLHGVVKSTSVLSSRLGVGGTGGWIIGEFTAQMRAISMIALHRRSNLAFFLEMHGSDVVDGLMQVLWGILDLEQPDTQTLNNIVISSVELIYCYAECLALHGKDTEGRSVAHAVVLFKKLLFSPNEAVQTSSSLAISSRLLQVPFPKQTMLGADDAVDHATSGPGPAETARVNAQVMIEEDSITSSVQYCCDGCSTVPILRRRWHCTICPDFDLCEACYQVLDADRLPPPHSRDHPMTAIPIEAESLGDGSEIHFSADESNDSNMLPVTTDVSVQNSAPSIHVLEPSESGEFSAPVADGVSISASKRAVNSLLLSELLKQLKGWMETTTGMQAIPIMQLFYRLSSAVGGPFVDVSNPEMLDLERLIRWFLDEINLNKPFVARARSSFGEVAILVFMFFTLMLRNWHQPGSDNSVSKASVNSETHDKNIVQVASVASQSFLDCQENNDFASQLLRACSSLRSQVFVNYLMDVLQQLVHAFKSPATSSVTTHGVNSGSGCGALLSVRRDLPAGNFGPFFSDSYAKAHREDIFIDYHRLLLENVFRLVYTLVRPEKQDKTGEREKIYKIPSALKLDGYQDVLCSYINNPHTSFVRRYARRLFLHLCGSKTHYYSVRDSWQFSSEVKKLYKRINKSGGLQHPVPYERSVKIVKCLSTMAEVAASRPRNWQKYCLKNGDVLPFLMNAVFYFGEESVVQALKLLNLAFYSGKDMSHSLQKVDSGDSGTKSNKSGTQSLDSKKKKKGEDGTESGLEKSYLDMETTVIIFSEKAGDVLKQFVDCFLLEWNSSSVRAEAKCVLYGAWHHGKSAFRETMLMTLLQKVKILPMYGQNIVEFTELIRCLLGKFPDTKQQSSDLVDRCLTSDTIRCIFETLHSQNELIANHPNSPIYNTLRVCLAFRFSGETDCRETDCRKRAVGKSSMLFGKYFF